MQSRTVRAVRALARAAVGALLATVGLAGCAAPGRTADELAASLGYTRSVADGAVYRHVVYANGRRAAGAALHVYIEGDGSPYLDRWTVAPDPTPRRPLMLRLMALDVAPAIYVGRPCYFGLATEPPCTPLDWTLGRFSARVVDSLAAVIEQQRRASGTESLELYGHSGGGTLAVLLAARLPGVTRVVTLAGNLDTAAWADLHRYTRLEGSLNPVESGPLPQAVRQQHFAGSRDRVVPPDLVRGAAARLGAPDAILLPGVTHTSGWEKEWPAILAGHSEVRASGD